MRTSSVLRSNDTGSIGDVRGLVAGTGFEPVTLGLWDINPSNTLFFIILTRLILLKNSVSKVMYGYPTLKTCCFMGAIS